MKLLITESNLEKMVFLWFDTNGGLFRTGPMASFPNLDIYKMRDLYIKYLDEKYQGNYQVFVDLLNKKYSQIWNRNSHYDEENDIECVVEYRINKFKLNEGTKRGNLPFWLDAEVDLKFSSEECFEALVDDINNVEDEMGNGLFHITKWYIDNVKVNIMN
jgi:hypothetical protein